MKLRTVRPALIWTSESFYLRGSAIGTSPSKARRLEKSLLSAGLDLRVLYNDSPTKVYRLSLLSPWTWKLLRYQSGRMHPEHFNQDHVLWGSAQALKEQGRNDETELLIEFL